MKRLILLIAVCLFFFFPSYSHAQSNTNVEKKYERAKVLKIVEQGTYKIESLSNFYQIVEIKLLTGPQKDKVLTIDNGKRFSIKPYQAVKKGEEVVVSQTKTDKGNEYFITDKYRLPQLFLVIFVFFGLVIFFGRLKGVTAIIGMLLSLFILLKFIVPLIAYGHDPMLVSFFGALAIMFISIFLAHGFNKRIVVAVASTFITLLLAVGLSWLFVSLTLLTGAGSEDAYSLQFGQFANLNLKGLLLGGIIIGTLGVLDDITTSQSAAIEEISKANKTLTPIDLYRKGISIGREHIASLVNTLILAYAGVSLPVFLFFLVYSDTQPLWITFNGEFVVEEIVRAAVGSSALILAVPISTLLAASVFGKKVKK